LKHVATRLVQLVVVLLAVTFITTFLISRFRGGNEVILCSILGPECGNEERAAELTEELHLDEGVVSRWLYWLGDALQGDLGISAATGVEVSELISDRAPVSIAIVIYAQILALLMAVPLGVIAAHRQGTAFDRGANATAFGLLAMPNYVVALLLIVIFPFGIGVFPAVAEGDVGPFDLYQLFLPSLALALGLVAIYTRLLRTDMISTLQEDFVGMAKAKGMPTRTILTRHALRPSSLNLLTTIGLNFGNLLAGAVVVEVIFNIQGLGSLLTTAVAQRDIFVIQGVTAVIAITFVIINFFVDTTYSILDPRIRRG
jgi:peptide/nickel transport system permease protein